MLRHQLIVAPFQYRSSIWSYFQEGHFTLSLDQIKQCYTNRSHYYQPKIQGDGEAWAHVLVNTEDGFHQRLSCPPHTCCLEQVVREVRWHLLPLCLFHLLRCQTPLSLRHRRCANTFWGCFLQWLSRNNNVLMLFVFIITLIIFMLAQTHQWHSQGSGIGEHIKIFGQGR